MRTIHIAVLVGLTVFELKPEVDAQGQGPCALLTLAEVQQAFPGATAGQFDRALEKDGILRCTWKYPTGTLILVASDEDESAKAGAQGMTLTFLDPLRGNAGSQVRYEVLPGIGNQAEAVAIVEREDKAKGFARDGAILVVQRGKHQVSAMSTDLARRERADALRVLTELGKAIAKRLG